MLRVALFGAGRIGQVHAQSIVESGDAELAWVCDPVETGGGAVGSSPCPYKRRRAGNFSCPEDAALNVETVKFGRDHGVSAANI